MLNPSILSGAVPGPLPGPAFALPGSSPAAVANEGTDNGGQSGLAGQPVAFGTALAAATGPFDAALQPPAPFTAPVPPAPIPAPPPVEFATGLAILPPVAFGKAAPQTGKGLPPAAPAALALPDGLAPLPGKPGDQDENDTDEPRAEPGLADASTFSTLAPIPLAPISLFAQVQPGQAPVALPQPVPFDRAPRAAETQAGEARPASRPQKANAAPLPPAASPTLALPAPVASEAGVALAQTAQLTAAPPAAADAEAPARQASLRVALRSGQQLAAAPTPGPGLTLAARAPGRDLLRDRIAASAETEAPGGSSTPGSTSTQVFSAPVSGPADSIAAPAAPRPMDFATLVDSIARARDEMAPRVVSVRLSHDDFGPVSLHFRHDGDALAVTMASADPGLVRAAAQAAPADAQTQGQNQSQSQNQPQAQPQGQATAQGREGGNSGQMAGQQRAGRDPSAASAEPRADQTGGPAATAPDIYA